MSASMKQIVPALVALGLLGGCLGGQTGQPGDSQNPCETPDFASLPFARAFEGEHRAPLVWDRRVPDGGGAATVDDELVLSISFGPAPHVSGGCGAPEVEVEVEVATRDLGRLEGGKGLLAFAAGDTQHARLAFIGQLVQISATLTRSTTTIDVSGALEAIGKNLPGEHAVFPAP